VAVIRKRFEGRPSMTHRWAFGFAFHLPCALILFGYTLTFGGQVHDLEFLLIDLSFLAVLRDIPL
jgi:hypothetical protein